MSGQADVLLQARGVHFSYQQGKPVICDASLAL